LLSPAGSQALGGLVFAVTFVWFGIVVLAGSVMLESRSRKRSGLNQQAAGPPHPCSGSLSSG
jgi:hypothetical protein